MPSLDQKSKGRHTYFSSDDINYFDVHLIHYAFLTKKHYISINEIPIERHMLYFQNLNMYVYIHYLSEHYINKA